MRRRPARTWCVSCVNLRARRLDVRFFGRFMTVGDGEQYTVPSLEALEHNLEVAMHKVRSEKDSKIGGEISYLENVVRTDSSCCIIHEAILAGDVAN